MAGSNDRLHALGYPTNGFERMIKHLLAFHERILPPIYNLAATAALEHYTATLAELLLSSEATRALFGNEDVLHLFLWHALEESEHKAVPCVATMVNRHRVLASPNAERF
jgi:predicted metal-dependent hydrolase